MQLYMEFQLKLLNMSNDLSVSVVMITYKHENFIEQAINGVLMQQIKYPVNLIIADDNSPDDTERIIRNIIKNHKNGKWIDYTKHTKNKGMMGNFLWALKKAKGKYIALCEGDDFWIDKFKLQKQVDFLEKNKNYSLCFHKVNIYYENNITPFLDDINSKTQDTTSLLDIIKSNYIHTMSIVFKNNNDYPDWLSTAYPGDWPLNIINATHGKMKFIPEKMASYRVHHGGVHSTTGGKPYQQIQTFKHISEELSNRGYFEHSNIINLNNDKAIINYFVFNKENLELTRWEKSSLLLNSMHKRFKFLFFIPIILNNHSYKIYKLYMQCARH